MRIFETPYVLDQRLLPRAGLKVKPKSGEGLGRAVPNGDSFNAPKTDPEERKDILLKPVAPPAFLEEDYMLEIDLVGTDPQAVGTLMTAWTLTRSAAIGLSDIYKSYATTISAELNTVIDPDEKSECRRRMALYEALILIKESQTLINLLDEHHDTVFTLRREIESETLQSITFENLPHLFNTSRLFRESDANSYGD